MLEFKIVAVGTLVTCISMEKYIALIYKNINNQGPFTSYICYLISFLLFFLVVRDLEEGKLLFKIYYMSSALYTNA